MRLRRGAQNGFGFRVGIGGIFTGSSDADAGAVATGAIAFPLGLNYLIGGRRHAFEAGVSLSPYYLSTDLHSPTAPNAMSQNGWGTHGFLDLGYRFQPLNNGLVFRVNWTPLVSAFVTVPGIFGISAGYGFK